MDDDGSFKVSLTVEAWRDGHDKDGRLYSVVLYAEDSAGVGTSLPLNVLVPHDQRK